MARREIPIVAGQCYHIFNRGNQKENIFFEKENYLFFIKKFRDYIGERVEMFCYCLMPNHYHFLLRSLDDEFSKGMQIFTISYVKSINKKYNRVGHLFQGSFKAKPVESDNVLLHVSRYIHLNPVFANLVKAAEDWEFSSYREYISKRNGTFPQPDFILSQFTSVSEYRDFVESYQEEDFDIIRECVFEEE